MTVTDRPLNGNIDRSTLNRLLVTSRKITPQNTGLIFVILSNVKQILWKVISLFSDYYIYVKYTKKQKYRPINDRKSNGLIIS